MLRVLYSIPALVVLVLGSCNKPPQFHLGDVVEVTDGFYRGCLGAVIGPPVYNGDRYLVGLVYCPAALFKQLDVWIDAEHMHRMQENL